jgi:hypothetical protein
MIHYGIIFLINNTMAQRISKRVKAIADAHIYARSQGRFNNPRVNTRQEAIDALLRGETIEEVLHQIEVRFCSITGTLLSRMFDYKSKSYVSGVYKGFRILLQQEDSGDGK